MFKVSLRSIGKFPIFKNPLHQKRLHVEQTDTNEDCFRSKIVSFTAVHGDQAMVEPTTPLPHPHHPPHPHSTHTRKPLVESTLCGDS